MWHQQIALVVILMIQVLDAVMQYSDRGAGEDAEQRGMQVEVLHWAAAIDDTGQCIPSALHHLCKPDLIFHLDLGKQVAAEALLQGGCVDLSN